jgi:glucosamine--fructose-6-phosphate aminotransferase (isomerizing)
LCGIVGYIGRRPALPVVLDGLRRLEYRGYDSAGVAVTGNGRVGVTKTEGRIATLIEKLAREGVPESTVGIGHTRWATHGRPSDANAHPHTDCHGRLAVVHNGIIENYLPLRQRLEAAGHRFRSETDTEVIPHLIEDYCQGDPIEAVRRATQDLQGSYAFVAVFTGEPDRLVAVRKDSPLVVGLGDGETFLASDIPAILRYTRRIAILEDGDLVVLERGKVSFFGRDGLPVSREPLSIDWDVEAADRKSVV